MVETPSEFGELSARVRSLERGLAENTATTRRIETLVQRNEDDTKELLELSRDAKGGFRMLAYLGSALKWIIGITAPIVAIWLGLKGLGK